MIDVRGDTISHFLPACPAFFPLLSPSVSHSNSAPLLLPPFLGLRPQKRGYRLRVDPHLAPPSFLPSFMARYKQPAKTIFFLERQFPVCMPVGMTDSPAVVCNFVTGVNCSRCGPRCLPPSLPTSFFLKNCGPHNSRILRDGAASTRHTNSRSCLAFPFSNFIHCSIHIILVLCAFQTPSFG